MACDEKTKSHVGNEGGVWPPQQYGNIQPESHIGFSANAAHTSSGIRAWSLAVTEASCLDLLRSLEISASRVVLISTPCRMHLSIAKRVVSARGAGSSMAVTARRWLHANAREDPGRWGPGAAGHSSVGAYQPARRSLLAATPGNRIPTSPGASTHLFAVPWNPGTG